MDNNLTNDFEVRLATLERLGGDMTKDYANIFEVDLAILEKTQGGGGGAIIDDTEVSTGKVWSSYKTQDYAAAVGFHYMYVQTLPATGQPRTIYFVPTGETPVQGQPNDVCNEYMYFGTPDSSFAYWEQIGTRRVDMSQYYTKAQIDASMSTKAEKSDVYDRTYIDGSLNTIKTNMDASFLSVDASLKDTYNKSHIDASINGLNSVLADVSTKMSDKVDVSDFLLDEQILANGLYNLNQKSSTAAQIDDVQISVATVWSSNKTNLEILNATAALNVSINTKLANLISGTNIKTIDNLSLLGSGNLVVGSNKELKTDADTASAIISESAYNLHNDKVYSAQIKIMMSLTQAEYDAIVTKDASTLYIITDASI